MSFVPKRNIFGLNEVRIPHRPAPRHVIDDAAELQDIRDELARDVDLFLQTLYQRARDIRYAADVEIDPRELCNLMQQTLEENALFGIDKRIEELRDAAPPVIASRPSIHGSAP